MKSIAYAKEKFHRPFLPSTYRSASDEFLNKKYADALRNDVFSKSSKEIFQKYGEYLGYYVCRRRITEATDEFLKRYSEDIGLDIDTFRPVSSAVRPVRRRQYDAILINHYQMRDYMLSDYKIKRIISKMRKKPKSHEGSGLTPCINKESPIIVFHHFLDKGIPITSELIEVEEEFKDRIGADAYIHEIFDFENPLKRTTEKLESLVSLTP